MQSSRNLGITRAYVKLLFFYFLLLFPPSHYTLFWVLIPVHLPVCLCLNAILWTLPSSPGPLVYPFHGPLSFALISLEPQEISAIRAQILGHLEGGEKVRKGRGYLFSLCLDYNHRTAVSETRVPGYLLWKHQPGYAHSRIV